MGFADIVPGASGGTIALITGIYSRLINAIKSFDPKIVMDIIKRDWKKSRKKVEAMDLQFLVPLGLGILGAFLLASSFLDTAVDQYREPTYSFFFGLILASALLIFRRQERKNLDKFFLAGILGFLIAFWITGLGEAGGTPLPHSYPVIFLSGAVAICAMILPGVSGAFILLLLGQWEIMISALHKFTAEWPKLVVFAFGAGLGILSFSRLISYLLRQYRDMTMGLLFGLMIGALRKMVEEISIGLSGAGISVWIVPVIFGTIGAALVFIIEGGTENRKITPP